MRPLAILLVGACAGLAAAGVMEGYQALAAEPFGQDDETEEPSTVKAADAISRLLTGEPIAEPRRAAAGRLVHYATGLLLGVSYTAAQAARPDDDPGLGLVYGLSVEGLLDDGLVPALGLAGPAWERPPAAHAYAVSAHLVFGVALEAARRIAVRCLD